jgi:hypothetical protein
MLTTLLHKVDQNHTNAAKAMSIDRAIDAVNAVAPDVSDELGPVMPVFPLPLPVTVNNTGHSTSYCFAKAG